MAASARIIQVAAEFPFKIKKLKVKKGQDISKGSLLCLYTTDTTAVHKFKSCHGGTINNIHVKEGQDVEEGYIMFTLEGCTHPTVMKDMCASCGMDLRLENSTAGNRKEGVTASVAMVHSIPELIVSEQMAQELGKADQDRLLSNRKLVLLVDLDQTIIHTTMDNVPANLKGVKHFQLWHGNQMMWHHTKFRPGTQKFLESISKLFELHICTFGSRMYAHTIAKILDPEGKFFSYRILSRDECFDATLKTANLKALFPCGDSMVCIIDDREDVWNYVPNMVHVKPYKFFEGTADINAPPGLPKSSEESKDPSSENKSKGDSYEAFDNVNENDSELKPMETNSSDVSDMKEYKTEDAQGDSVVQSEGNDNDDGKMRESQDAVPGQMDTDITVKQCINEHAKEVQENKETDNTDNSIKDNQLNVSPIRECSEKKDACENLEIGEDGRKKEISEKLDTISEDSSLLDQSDVNNENHSGKGRKCTDPKTENECKDNVAIEVDPESKFTNSGEMEGKDMSDKDLEMKIGDGNDESGQTDKANEDKSDKGDESKSDKDIEEIEWEDEDDYLFYLEDILKNIHKAFYDMHDQMKEKNPDDEKPSPSLKDIIPYIKKKILKDCNIVFSGVVPTNMQVEKNRAYIMAVSLGANVQNEIKNSSNEKDPNNYTTHLIAARDGTSKVRTATKFRQIKIVNLKWLWSCYERWERVEESLFADISTGKQSEGGRDSPDPRKLLLMKKRKVEPEDMNVTKKAKYGLDKDIEDDDEDTSNGDSGLDLSNESTFKDDVSEESKPDQFSATYNPLYAFSDDDIALMDKEVEDEIDDGEESSEDEDARDERLRKQVLIRKIPEAESSSEDSMTGDMPRGWGLKGKLSPKWSSDEDEKRSSPRELGPEYESETDQDKFENIMEAFGPVTSSDDDYQESIGSVDDEMADAVMKEFLS